MSIQAHVLACTIARDREESLQALRDVPLKSGSCSMRRNTHKNCKNLHNHPTLRYCNNIIIMSDIPITAPFALNKSAHIWSDFLSARFRALGEPVFHTFGIFAVPSPCHTVYNDQCPWCAYTCTMYTKHRTLMQDRSREDYHSLNCFEIPLLQLGPPDGSYLAGTGAKAYKLHMCKATQVQHILDGWKRSSPHLYRI